MGRARGFARVRKCNEAGQEGKEICEWKGRGRRDDKKEAGEGEMVSQLSQECRV